MRALLAPALAALAVLAACAQPASEDAAMPSMTWYVDTQASMLTFISVKNGDLDEEHELGGVSGSLNEDGEARLELDMSSVETFIPIRNERMAEHVFETATYPAAQIEAQLDYASIADIAIGASITRDIDFTLTLRGVDLGLGARVEITRIGETEVRVSTTQPVIVEAGALGLLEGLETLRGLAGLDAISPTVPVDFDLTFRR